MAGILAAVSGLLACADDAQPTATRDDLSAPGSAATVPAIRSGSTGAPDPRPAAPEGESFGGDLGPVPAPAPATASAGASNASAGAPVVDIAPVLETCSDNPLLAGCGGATNPAPRPTAGTLTAGAWDDNRNITRFLE